MSSADRDGSGAPDPTLQFRVEVALAMLVGAEEETAVTLTRRVSAEWPALGVLVVSAAAASRWGIDIVPAMVRLADGDALRGAMSDYELRTATEEAEDEAESCLDRLAGAVGADADLQVPSPSAPYVLRSEQLLRDAVLAAIAGRAVWELPGSDGELAAHVMVLAHRLGARVITQGDIPSSPSTVADDAQSGDVYVGFSRIFNL